jgi:hypothetical protein
MRIGLALLALAAGSPAHPLRLLLGIKLGPQKAPSLCMQTSGLSSGTGGNMGCMYCLGVAAAVQRGRRSRLVPPACVFSPPAPLSIGCCLPWHVSRDCRLASSHSRILVVPLVQDLTSRDLHCHCKSPRGLSAAGVPWRGIARTAAASECGVWDDWAAWAVVFWMLFGCCLAVVWLLFGCCFQGCRRLSRPYFGAASAERRGWPLVTHL